jgi:hypothetical protein
MSRQKISSAFSSNEVLSVTKFDVFTGNNFVPDVESKILM